MEKATGLLPVLKQLSEWANDTCPEIDFEECRIIDSNKNQLTTSYNHINGVYKIKTFVSLKGTLANEREVNSNLQSVVIL